MGLACESWGPMIRINLSRPTPWRETRPGFQAGQKMMVDRQPDLVLTAVGVGWRFWALGQQKSEVVAQIEVSSAKKRASRKSSSRFEAFQNRRRCSRRWSR